MPMFDKNPYDLSPGKQHLSERELEKLALQGIFDYPHNKINNQMTENIDLKDAEKKYYHKFKAHNQQHVNSDRNMNQGFNRYKKSLDSELGKTNKMNGAVAHYNSYDNLNEMESLNNQPHIQSRQNQLDNPYRDQEADRNEVKSRSETRLQTWNGMDNNSRNNYQNLNGAQQRLNSSVSINIFNI